MHITPTQTIIELQDVSFSYNSEKVLDNISLQIHKGDYLGIIGPNGGGKTTLLKIILGLLTPTQGSILLFGTPLARFKDWKKIGYVPQKATNFEHNFPATVEEVVAMGRYVDKRPFQMLGAADQNYISQALREVDMIDLKDRNISELSGGQQQRVFIARSLAAQPEILFLDEPTVGVDVETQKQFYALLKKLNEHLGLTLVLVSHDIDVIVHETTEVACVNKTLVYETNPKDLLNHQSLQRTYGEQMQYIGHKHEHKDI